MTSEVRSRSGHKHDGQKLISNTYFSGGGGDGGNDGGGVEEDVGDVFE
jgi:hypothetical protein